MAHEKFCCEKCGGNLELNGSIYVCSYCGSEFADIIVEKAYKKLELSLREKFGDLVQEELIKREQEKFRPLLGQLWDKLQEKFTDSKAILSICSKIKDIYPDNFIANFCEVANGGSVSQINDFLNNIDVKENSIFIEDIVKFMAKSLETGNVASLNYLIERAFKQTDLVKFEEYSTVIENEANKLDEGIYNTNLPRDVFVAYSSKDIDKVLELVENIEAQGLTCFIAMRNLRHGRGAKANYLTELQTAMKNCRNLIFVSSKNSRALNCDALKIELPFIKELDIANIPVGYKNNYADPKVLGYKKPRIEYRLDNEKTPFADIFLKEFFAGLEYAKSLDDTLERLALIITNGFGEKNLTNDDTKAEERIKELEKMLENERLSKQPSVSLSKPKESEFKQPIVSPSITQEIPKAENRIVSLKDCKVGDYIKFGKYEQDNNIANGKEDIEWLVLDKVDGKALVISKYALDCKQYNTSRTNVTWETCSIRSWLNTDFINSAFSNTEKEMISTVTVTADQNSKYSTNPGINTADKVFLLSAIEANKYFNSDTARKCAPTAYAKARGCYADDTNGNCWCWWRSIGEFQDRAVFTNYIGVVYYHGNRVDREDYGVRPAFWICVDEGEKRKEEELLAREKEEKDTLGLEKQAELKAKNDFTFRNNFELIAYKGTDKQVVVPNQAKSIGYEYWSVFTHRDKYPSSKEKIGAFEDSCVEKIVLPPSVESISEFAFKNAKKLHTIEKTNIKRIGDCAFEGCESLKDFYFSSIIVEVGKNAFKDCIALETVNLMNYDAKFGEGVFANCKNLSCVIMHSKWTKIADETFYGCKGLQDLMLPIGLKEICSMAFKDCTGLKKLILPSTVGKIASNAFDGCSNLSIYYNDKAIPNSIPGDFNGNRPVYVKDGNGNWIQVKKTFFGGWKPIK